MNRVLGGALLALLVAGCATVSPSPSESQRPSREPLLRLAIADLAVDYPSAWAVHTDMPRLTGFGQPLAILGTLPWGPCDETDVNCHFAQRLGPGQIDVQVVAVSGAGTDLCARATLPIPSTPAGPTRTMLRIHGRPAILLVYPWSGQDYYRADAEKVWSIAIDGTVRRWVVVDARYRRPGDDEFSAELDALIASLAMPKAVPGEQGPGDCGSPFPTPGT